MSKADFDHALRQCEDAISAGDRAQAFYAIMAASSHYGDAIRGRRVADADQQRMLDAFRATERRFVDRCLGGDPRRGGKARRTSAPARADGVDLADAVKKLTR